MSGKNNKLKVEDPVEFIRRLREPLAAVSAASQVLSENVKLSGDKKLFDIVHKEIQNMNFSIDEFLSKHEFSIENAKEFTLSSAKLSNTQYRMREQNRSGSIRPIK